MLTPKIRKKADIEAERSAQIAEENKKRLEKETARDFRFQATTIEGLRAEMNTYQNSINAILGLVKNGAAGPR